MDRLRYWQLKIFQLLHDPPGKAYHLTPRGEGSRTPGSPTTFLKHTDLARQLFERFTWEPQPRGLTRPDRAATGADRPVVAASWGRGRMFPLPYQDRRDSVALHPLAPGARLWLDPMPDTHEVDSCDVLEDDDLQRAVVGFLADITSPSWNDATAVEDAAMVLWRRTRDELQLRSEESAAHPRADLLWAHMPADTRVPDHSIWDHTRMAATLAFMDAPSGKKGKLEPEKEPWLLQVSLTPIGEFIRQSRKAQDLWVSSFLLADLSWHAMLPVVKAYGPDNIVYPDLRGNPRVDHWLCDAHPEALAAGLENPTTYAAVLPNAFTAIVPRGGTGQLARVEDLAKQCVSAVQERWRELAAVVWRWFRDKAQEHRRQHQADLAKLEADWHQQHERVVHARWTAVPWMLPEANAAARAARLKPWVPPDVWSRYEEARAVFAKMDEGLLTGERGFDYALTHHQLRVRHAMRKQTAMPGIGTEQPGEKCTLCGTRTALGDPATAATPRRAAIESRRQVVRSFWSQGWLDPEETGAERLCAVCTFKRFLIEADGDDDNGTFNRIWAGIQKNPDDLRRDGGGKVRVPFPSTSAIAAQRFLAEVVRNEAFAPAVARIVEAHRKAIGKETQFPLALPELAAAYDGARDRPGGAFLRIDAESTVFPRTLDIWIQRYPDKAAELRTLQRESFALLRQAREAGVREPGKRIAVIQMDGDAMGKLLLGAPDRIGTRWQDVIHPRHLERMLKDSHARQAGWPDLLGTKRLMGPALHAFISRALADFNHQVVPWVVEREYSGRLVYTGGDDVLALAPADEAIHIAARLHELFSAPWVADTHPRDQDPWEWRSSDWHGPHEPEEAKKRFTVISENASPLAEAGRVIPMLGPVASLSAGITLGHFKAPLRRMLQKAHHLLEDVAKEVPGKSAVALSYYTRSGPKYELAMKWGDASSPAGERVAAPRVLGKVVEAFERGKLPSRLPYKLREAASSLHGAFDAIEESVVEHDPDRKSEDARVMRRDLMSGLLRRELDGKRLDDEVESAVLHLWQVGVDRSRREQKKARPGGEEPPVERMVDGLLIARALASGEPEDEE